MNERIELRDRFRRGVIDKHEYSRAMSSQHNALREYVELLRDSDISSIEITSEGIWLRSRLAPVAIACDPADRGTPPMVSLNFGQYESPEFNMWHRLVRKGAVIADVGANIGWYCAHFAAMDPTARVIAFEPVPSSFYWLSKTIARNELHNVLAENLAISEKAGHLTLYVDTTIAGAASAHPTSYAESSVPVAVNATTLDDYVSLHNIRLDAVKLDVEGGELAVLRGATRILSEHRPIILSEMLRRHARAFGYHPNDIIAFMRSFNYACFTTNDDRLVPFDKMKEEAVETNFFFIDNEAHVPQIAAA